MDEGFSRKRELSNTDTDSSFSSSSPVSSSAKTSDKKDKQERKKTKMSELGNEEASLSMVLKSLNDLNRKHDELTLKLENNATKEDIKEMKSDLEKVNASLNLKIDKLDGRVYELEKKNDELQNALASQKAMNETLRSDIVGLVDLLREKENDHNELEQYGRNWSVRIFGVKEPQEPGAKETVDDCAQKAVRVFRDMIGIEDITTEDIEMCHRTGSLEKARTNNKNRPIIVRFFSRRKRDKVLKTRKVLKGKKVSVGEDLTMKNVRLLKRVDEHSATMSAWSHNGHIFAKLKNGLVRRVDLLTDIDKMFNECMRRRGGGYDANIDNDMQT